LCRHHRYLEGLVGEYRGRQIGERIFTVFGAFFGPTTQRRKNAFHFLSSNEGKGQQIRRVLKRKGEMDKNAKFNANACAKREGKIQFLAHSRSWN